MFFYKSLSLKAFVAFLVISFSGSSYAKEVFIPAPPQIAGSSYLLMDARTGEIIVEKNSEQALPPASLTKMMTAYIVESEIDKGNMNLYDEVPVSVKAWRTGGSKMWIREGTKVLLEDLLRGVIIQSGNDASIALAEYVAGSEEAFADIMNQQAKALGMTGTNFENSTGLPSANHYTTAKDMALLAKAIVYDYPEQYAVYAERNFTYNNISQPNRNGLLWRDKSVDGLKTGHTEEAGYCLVASAKRDDMRLITVVMGTVSKKAREKETQKLLEYGFRYYQTAELYDAAQVLNTSQVWGGAVDQFDLGLAEDVIVTIPRGAKAKLDAKIEVDPVIEAPVEVGQSLGRLVVKLEDNVIVDEPLVALNPVPEGGFFKRLWDWIKLFFIGLFN